jgi:hypothetical protein
VVSEVVEPDSIANPPSNKVVGARGIAAHADAADFFAARSQQYKPATECVHPTDALPDQRIAQQRLISPRILGGAS